MSMLAHTYDHINSHTSLDRIELPSNTFVAISPSRAPPHIMKDFLVIQELPNVAHLHVRLSCSFSLAFTIRHSDPEGGLTSHSQFPPPLALLFAPKQEKEEGVQFQSPIQTCSQPIQMVACRAIAKPDGRSDTAAAGPSTWTPQYKRRRAPRRAARQQTTSYTCGSVLICIKRRRTPVERARKQEHTLNARRVSSRRACALN